MKQSRMQIWKNFKFCCFLQVELERHRPMRRVKMCELLDVVSRFFMAYGIDGDDQRPEKSTGHANALFKDVKSHISKITMKSPANTEIHHLKLHMQVTKTTRTRFFKSLILSMNLGPIPTKLFSWQSNDFSFFCC